MTHKAKLVIIGSGIVGCSAAYHLTNLGWKDILVVDKGHPFENDGSTSHAPGGVVGLSHSKVMTQFAQYTSKLIGELKPYREDQYTYNPVGGIEIAISEPRWQDLKRLHSAAKAFGAESVLLTPAEAKEKAPYLNTDAFIGGLFVPRSAIVKGAHVSGALARDAEATGGAKFVGQTLVTEIEVKHGQVQAVVTNNPEMPRIECEQVLLCTNIWGPVLGDQLGVKLPLMAFEHQYVITKPLPELAHYDPANKDDEVNFPTMRELDSTMYYRKHWNAYGIGSYWHRPHMVSPYDIKGNAMNPFTPEDFEEPWKQAVNLIPMLAGAELEKAFNGMFAFSVDGYPIMGETHIQGLWTAVASWITHAGGVGKSIAEWMTHGEAEWDMRQCSVLRFNKFQTTQTYTHIVTQKNYREVYDIIHPSQPITEPRKVRLSPFYARHEGLDCSFTAFAGLELPNWYAQNGRLLEQYEDRIPQRSGWAAQFWSPIQGAEHLATRENAALYDLTGLSIIEVKGSGAAAFVNYLCSNQMDKPVGDVVYTTWLTPSGGVKRDLAVARLADDQFWMFVGEGTLPQDLAWVNRHAPKDGSVIVTDISDNYSALGLWGPNAGEILSKVTTADLSDEAFPYYTGQWIEIGPVPVYAMRISYVGEYGWELHIPMDSSLPVWDAIWAAGREVDLVTAGMGAMDSLRLEKGYRLWGMDVYTEYTPYEAGLGWTVKLNKGEFIGREACLKAKEKGLKKKLCCLTMEAPDAAAFGYEPIFSNGNCIGHVTTGNYGYSVGKYIVYGYLPVAYAKPGTELEVEYFNERYPATVAKEPLYDPKMMVMKGG